MHLCKLTQYLPQNKASLYIPKTETKTAQQKSGVCLTLRTYRLGRLELVELTISRARDLILYIFFKGKL